MNILEFQRNYFELLQSDELEQFKGEGNTNTQVVLKALGRQLDDVLAVFHDLASKRHIDGAEGVQLDGCGDIVKLTRAQAAMLSNEVTTDFASINKEVLENVTTPMDLLKRHAHHGLIPFDVIDDERYQEYLKYKIFLNTNTCTYPEVMKAVRMFWTRSPVHYIEDVRLEEIDYHAAMILDAGVLRPEQNARLFFLFPIIKAAGVMLFRRAETRASMEPVNLHMRGVIGCTAMRTRLPHMHNNAPMHAQSHVIPRMGSRMRTSLPEIGGTQCPDYTASA